LLVDAPSNDDNYIIFAASLEKTGSFVLKVIERASGHEGNEKLAKRQAHAAVALIKMGPPEKVWPLLKHGPDPSLRSYLIHRLGPFGANSQAIIQRLSKEPDVTIRRALVLSLGEFTKMVWADEEPKVATKDLQEIFRADDDPGLHGAAEWVMRKWKNSGDYLRRSG
jgi:hypothetical protein